VGNPATPSLAGSLDGAAVNAVAAYYAALQPQRANVSKPLTPDEWAQKCDRCHGPNGNSARPDIPALAGQRMDYLEAALHDYQSRERRNSEMAAMAAVLGPDDIKGMATHYSHERARAVVFVTVPGK
jgi:cytochrome c553